MNSRLFLVSALVLLASLGPLAAAEPAGDVLVASSLRPIATITVTAPPAVELRESAFEGFIIMPPAGYSLPRPFPSPAAPPSVGKALFDANLVLMVGLNVADYFSTKEALKYPGLEETNPLMKPFVKSPAAFAAIKAGTTALSYWSMKSLFKKNRTMAWIMTTASNAVLSYVVLNNMRLVRNARTL